MSKINNIYGIEENSWGESNYKRHYLIRFHLKNGH